MVLVPFMAMAGDLTTCAWPDPDWPEGTPESQGLSSAALQKAAAWAQASGGGSGCILRHGVLVEEWGSRTERADIKSATKGFGEDSFSVRKLTLDLR